MFPAYSVWSHLLFVFLPSLQPVEYTGTGSATGSKTPSPGTRQMTHQDVSPMLVGAMAEVRRCCSAKLWINSHSSNHPPPPCTPSLCSGHAALLLLAQSAGDGLRADCGMLALLCVTLNALLSLVCYGFGRGTACFSRQTLSSG